MIFPTKFAQDWVSAWNQRDLEALLAFYAENIELRSPFAKVYATDGIIHNKTELRAYWSEVIRRMPKLNLELIAVYPGHQAMTLHYVDEARRNVMETMWFNAQDKICIEAACLIR